MVLAELMVYIRERRRVSLDEVARRFASDPEAVEGMLDLLAAKGRIRPVTPAACDGQCCSCSSRPSRSPQWEIVAPN